MHQRRAELLLLIALALPACSGATAHPARQAETSAAAHAARTPSAPERPPAGKEPGSPLTDDAPVTFRDELTQGEHPNLYNLFGLAAGKREVMRSPDGLWVRVVRGEKPWDAVGMRTARIAIQGDFDLRGRFRDFSAEGNGAAKLIVVDARSPRGEAAYVERIRVDGKDLFKFGGEVEGSLETWGFVPTDANKADLRLARQGAKLHAYHRTDDRGSWNEIAAPVPVPSSMPGALKFGVKLSADAQKRAEVRWIELTMDGTLASRE